MTGFQILPFFTFNCSPRRDATRLLFYSNYFMSLIVGIFELFYSSQQLRRRCVIYGIVIIVFLIFWSYHSQSALRRFSFPVKGLSSWYSRNDPGINKRTANNEIFNDQAMTCAMWGVRFGQRLKVTNLENGKHVVARVNDRGPHDRFLREGRVIDLTKAAFRKISPTKKGLIKVRVELYK